MSLEAVLDHIDARRDECLETLFELLRQPSISAQDNGVLECAELLRDTLRGFGIESSIIPTEGYPVVYGEVTAEREDAFTVLFYGHYDVQPPEPLEAWESGPFDPTVRDGRVYARGAGDNKGQLITHVLAVRAFLETAGAVPINVKFVFEGEEESGSPNLLSFVEGHRDLLKADLVYTSDGGYDDSGRPVVCFGVRGMLALELEARGAKSDLHSGNRGNVVPNPAWTLIDLLHTMRDPTGRVTIEGFYDDVREPTEIEDELAAKVPFDRDAFLSAMGLGDTPIRNSQDYARRLMFESTFNIAGFTSGYGGEGIKTIIPSRAGLKMDLRLVADQNPDDIYAKFERHVEEHAPDVMVRRLGAMNPSRSSPELPVSRLIVETVEKARGEEPVVIPSLGGSLPDYVWTRTLGAPSVLVPYANPDENNHGPNENLKLDAFFFGIKTSVRVLEAFRDFRAEREELS